MYNKSSVFVKRKGVPLFRVTFRTDELVNSVAKLGRIKALTTKRYHYILLFQEGASCKMKCIYALAGWARLFVPTNILFLLNN
jgi:hypothetical protein